GLHSHPAAAGQHGQGGDRDDAEADQRPLPLAPRGTSPPSGEETLPLPQRPWSEFRSPLALSRTPSSRASRRNRRWITSGPSPSLREGPPHQVGRSPPSGGRTP